MPTKTKIIANFLFEIGSLRKIARSHRQTLFTDDLSDNIASHSYRVTFIGYFLAKLEQVDSDKVLKMCLIHDIGESRSGDQNWLHKKYVKTFDRDITHDQFAQLPYSQEFQDLSEEYEKRESIESKVAKDADLIDQILLLREYDHAGNKEAASWLEGKYHFARLTTKSGKDLAQVIYTQPVSDWWFSDWTSDRLK